MQLVSLAPKISGSVFLGGECFFFFVFLVGLRSNCCGFVLSYCGIALSRVAFCFCFALTCCGIALSKVAFCRKVLGDSNFEAPVLRQAIEELQLAGFRFAPSY